MGSVHFWCNFLGTKKVYKVENQLLVDYSERRGGFERRSRRADTIKRRANARAINHAHIGSTPTQVSNPSPAARSQCRTSRRRFVIGGYGSSLTIAHKNKTDDLSVVRFYNIVLNWDSNGEAIEPIPLKNSAGRMPEQ